MAKLIKGVNDLQTLYPDIAAQWHPTKNGDLMPTDVTGGSNKKIWWLYPYDDLDTGKHFDFEWEAIVASRVKQGSNVCPFLSNAVWSGYNDLLSRDKDVALDWSYEDNGDVTPDNVAWKSNYRAVWKCHVCGHKWSSSVSNRTNLHRGCPMCGRKKMGNNHHKSYISNHVSFADSHPEIAAQWHPTKNGDLTPYDITHGYSKKVWWLYPYDDPDTGKHFDFEWESSPSNRIKSSGCPFLSGRCWSGFNDLQTKYPELAKEYDTVKNKTDVNIVGCSSSDVVWWKCSVCGYEWKARVANRVHLDRGCPECGKLQASISYRTTRITTVGSLSEVNPVLAKQWHPTKNGDLTPDEITAGCSDMVWWLYPYDVPDDYPIKSLRGKHFDFEWQATVASRNSGCSCPFLSGRCWSGFNDIATTHPDIVKHWNYDKNTLSPTKVTKGCRDKVWWNGDCGHVFKSSVATQCKYGIKCPICAKEQQTSFPEQSVFYYIKQCYPDAINSDRSCLDGFELDIYIPSINVAIEYDGSAWHKDTTKDLDKDLLCQDKNIKLFRIRESDCKSYDYKSFKTYSWNYGIYDELNSIITDILSHITNMNIDVNIERDKQLIHAMYLGNKKDKSVAKLYPHLLKQVHPTKNGSMTLDMVTKASEKKFWWVCDNNHEYECTVKEMTHGGQHCPYCNNHKLLKGFNDLESKYPDIASEWDYTKNVSVPSNVLWNSHEKYSFICSVCGYRWNAYLSNRVRNGSGCPNCAHKKVAHIRRKRVLNIELNQYYDGCRAAADSINVSLGTISDACLHGNSVGGYHWKYVEEEE